MENQRLIAEAEFNAGRRLDRSSASFDGYSATGGSGGGAVGVTGGPSPQDASRSRLKTGSAWKASASSAAAAASSPGRQASPTGRTSGGRGQQGLEASASAPQFDTQANNGFPSAALNMGGGGDGASLSSVASERRQRSQSSRTRQGLGANYASSDSVASSANSGLNGPSASPAKPPLPQSAAAKIAGSYIRHAQ